MRRTRCRPLTISMTAPGAVATPPSTSPAAPGITEDILASEEPGTKGNTTVIVQTVAGSDGSSIPRSEPSDSTRSSSARSGCRSL